MQDLVQHCSYSYNRLVLTLVLALTYTTDDMSANRVKVPVKALAVVRLVFSPFCSHCLRGMLLSSACFTSELYCYTAAAPTFG